MGSVESSVSPEGLRLRFGHSTQAEVLAAVRVEAERSLLPLADDRFPPHWARVRVEIDAARTTR